MTDDHKLFDQAARHFLDEYSHSGSIETLHQIRPANIDTQLILNYYEELKAQYEANEYQRLRAAEYPSWQDQLDKIYHDGVMAWQKEIKAIKDKYPKPDQA